MREMFQDYITFLNGYDKRLSLSNCSREQARQLIEVILDWVFHNNIPLNYKTSDLLKQDKSFYIGLRSIVTVLSAVNHILI